jgi:lipopolysaccharide export system permease protein
MATFAMGLDLVFSEVAPPANAERLKLLAGTSSNAMDDRYNFAFASDEGRVYRVYTLSVKEKSLNDVEIEERGGPKRPGLLISAKRGHWTAKHGWTLQSGVLHVIPNETADLAFSFDSLVDRRLKETPQELRATERDPAEMRFAELTRFIKALERSGADVNTLKVERMLKIAIPVTCLIIALFGAPLATSSQRGGAAYGIAVSLATTVFFLVLIQLTKAIGGKGLVSPDMAAWIPNLLVGSFAIILMTRVRT